MKKNTEMEDIVDWLASVENRAAILYSQAAYIFAADKEFAAFLNHLATEEQEHVDLLSKATGSIAWEASPESFFSLDETARQNMEGPFNRVHALLKSRGLTKKAMLETIAEAEFSEWNEIFLYVVDVLKGHGRELQKAIAEIEHHRKEIESFIASFPWGEGILQKVGRLRSVWKRRILVVEDDHAIAALMLNLLEADSEVVLAADGVKGLELIRQEHFDVVVSDIEMPNLNGIEMYKEALAIDPDLRKRFVFFSAAEDQNCRRFIESTGCVLLTKPAPLGLLRKIIYKAADAD